MHAPYTSLIFRESEVDELEDDNDVDSSDDEYIEEDATHPPDPHSTRVVATNDRGRRGRRGSVEKESTSGKRREKHRSKSPVKEYYNEHGIKLEVREIAINFDRNAWLKHVVEDGKPAVWRCTWQTMRNGVPATCTYATKKHLVKRHIEATHMSIK